MCGRFLSSSPVSDLAERFGAELTIEDREPRFNVAPTDDVLAVATSKQGDRRLGLLSWGLVPHWTTGSKPAKRLINVRSETLPERSGFRTILQRRRCILPADGFYEWRKAGDGRARQAFLIRAAGGEPLALAGLWDIWAPDDGPDAGQRIRTCTILTTAPNLAVASLHDRMPVILPAGAWEPWLDPAVSDLALLQSFLRPSDEPLDLVPVGPLVNNVKNDGPELIEPVADAGA